MTRDEHLAWCKQRALEYVDAGDLDNAVVSMLSDLRKHPELEKHAGGTMMLMLRINGHLSTAQEVRKFIDGFN